jgi:RND family efflux transporter MFP subunit
MLCITAAGCGSTAARGDGRTSLHANGEAVVRARPIEDVYLLTGELAAVRSIDLTTPRSDAWQVQIKWLAEDGAELKAGDRAVEFDNSQIVQTIEEKKLALFQADVNLESRHASLRADREDRTFAVDRALLAVERARMDAGVPQDLLERRKWQERQAVLRTAEATLEKARMDLEAFEVSSKAELDMLRIARDKAARDIEAAQKGLEALAVRAPRDGIFVVADNWREDRKYQAGDITWPGQTIATIPDLSVMEVRGYLPEVDDGRIAPGQKIRCILDTYPDRVFTGRIEEVASVASEGSWRTRGGFLVRASLGKSDPVLMRPGMSARVEVVRAEWPRALTVPRGAVLREGSRSWVERPGGGSRVDVKLAACTPTDCVVESGLVEGDRVAVR